MTEVAAEKNSTLVLPIPIELLGPYKAAFPGAASALLPEPSRPAPVPEPPELPDPPAPALRPVPDPTPARTLLEPLPPLPEGPA